jgi:hypothetical protein
LPIRRKATLRACRAAFLSGVERALKMAMSNFTLRAKTGKRMIQPLKRTVFAGGYAAPINPADELI